MTYYPSPLDTSGVEIPNVLLPLIELLAENAHENWAVLRIREGWTYGPKRDDDTLTTPNMVPYSELPEKERDYDRRLACETIRVLLKAGYRITRDSG